jgi:copper resistance protein B
VKRLLAALALAGAAPFAAAQEHVDHSTMDHSKMGHATEQAAPPPPPEPAAVDPSTMDHSKMGHAMPPAPAPADATLPRTPIPVLTDADRAAAKLPAGGHAAHGKGVHSLFGVDRLEAWDSGEAQGGAWELHGWVGGDIHKFRFRAEGETEGGALGHAELDLLYARAVTPWWDAVVGLHHENGASTRDALALGVMGLAPYKIETQAMLYLGEGGASLRAEASYDTLFTNRWILQSRVEARAESRADEERGVGAGLSRIEAGLRLRYEWHRQFAPYVGLVREQAFGGTADRLRAQGEPAGDWRVVVGLRTWF